MTITVNPVNDPPATADDSYEVDEDGALTVPATGVLANDADVDGDVLTVTDFTQPANGTAAVNPDGSFAYTPNPDFFGTDAFTYTASDGHGGIATGTVTITVIPAPDDPVAADDTATTDEDTPVSGNVLANDFDPDNQPPGNAGLTVESFTQPVNGTVVLDTATGDYTFTPNPDFFGTDSFTYTVVDATGRTATGTVTITVNPVNDDPTAVGDAFATEVDTPLAVPAAAGVLANDFDVDDQPPGNAGLTATPGTFATTQGGAVVLDADGSFTYTPAAGFAGEDTFVYTVADPTGRTAAGTAAVTVAAVP